MTIEKYRSIDLTLLCILAALFEFLGNYLSERWAVGFSLSFASLIAIIGIFRWGYRGAIIYIVAGIPMAILKHDQLFSNILFYCVANGFIVIVPFLLRKLNFNKIRDNTYLFILNITLICLSIVVGKGLVLILLGESQGIIAFFGAFLFTIVINIILLNILKRVDGLITDMSLKIKENLEESYETGYNASK